MKLVRTAWFNLVRGRAEPLIEIPSEVDLEGRIDEANGIEYLGKAKRQPDGKYHVLANVNGALAMVEVTLYPKMPE